VCRFAKDHKTNEAKKYSSGGSSWQGSAKRSKQSYEGGGGRGSRDGSRTRSGASSWYENPEADLAEMYLNKQKLENELMSRVLKARRGARGENKGGQQGGSDDDTTDGGEPPWGLETDDSEDEGASERCRARYGLRGVRVGEASHPGPQLRLAEAFARVLNSRGSPNRKARQGRGESQEGQGAQGQRKQQGQEQSGRMTQMTLTTTEKPPRIWMDT
jgi:hypothetical protein